MRVMHCVIRVSRSAAFSVGSFAPQATGARSVVLIDCRRSLATVDDQKTLESEPWHEYVSCQVHHDPLVHSAHACGVLEGYCQ